MAMVKRQQKKPSKLRKSSVRIARKRTEKQILLPLITKTVESTEGGCADSLTLSMQVEKDKVTNISIKPSRTSCIEVKKVCMQVPDQVKGKHMSDIYRIKEEVFDAKAMPHHSSTLVVYALRQALLEYESQKANAALREAVTMLQEYDKGLPERDLGTDYEY